MGFIESQNAFADAVLHADRPVPKGIVTARGGAVSARFAVYRNNVFVSLTKALAQQFPVTERLVGPEFFAVMARAYAQDHKPPSPLMIEYGNDFADFITGFEPAAELAYLPDVARIETAWIRAYHAANATPLDLKALSAAPPEFLSDLRLVAHPSASLIPSHYPAGSIWSAHQDEVVTPIAAWQPQTVLVVRPDMSVNVHILPAQDASFAAHVLNGATLGDAAEVALAANSDFNFGTALIGLIGLGAFSALQQDEGNTP
ncbi:MAG: DNA-binding domain-containing protein [Allorhizobium sp.]